ncbi:MAG: response regulator transcription factor [Leptolyngbya sp. SIO3F4]|nr:response regulator transcription factor [Leptolyngbya sp. SIO3F4]
MAAATRLLIVEDEPLVAQELKTKLSELGIQHFFLVATGAEALAYLEQAQPFPDAILLDIQLRGEMDGIQVAERIRTFSRVPIFFLTNLRDGNTFQRALPTTPAHFMYKPVDSLELQRNLVLAFQQQPTGSQLFYVRDGEMRIALKLEQIFYLQADEQYCYVNIRGSSYYQSISLRKILTQLQELEANRFVRIHKSYAVNLQHVQGEVKGGKVRVAGTDLPVGRAHKQAFRNALKTHGR